MMIYLFDFEDSFTYNLYTQLKEHTVGDFGEVEVFHWSAITQLHKDWPFQKDDLVVLGPGPGHPQAYSQIFPFLRELLSNPDYPYFFGVCLGHQLIWEAMGHCVTRLENPVHGQSLALKRPGDWKIWEGVSEGESREKLEVQRYNSLVMRQSRELKKYRDCKLWIEREILWGSLWPRGVSYQFHPESVGTSCPSLFFRSLKNLRYNGRDGYSNRRSLRQKNH